CGALGDGWPSLMAFSVSGGQWAVLAIIIAKIDGDKLELLGAVEGCWSVTVVYRGRNPWRENFHKDEFAPSVPCLTWNQTLVSQRRLRRRRESKSCGGGGEGGDSEMQLLQRTSSMSGGDGRRGLTLVDSLPRSPVELAPWASLAKSESVKKRDMKKGSRRARLRGISVMVCELHLAGGHHRAGRSRVVGGGNDEEVASVAATAAVGVVLLLAARNGEARPAAVVAVGSLRDLYRVS
ncbi:hypothetical protein E2562_022535, partial [Oryza meyeriana var. granulata]